MEVETVVSNIEKGYYKIGIVTLKDGTIMGIAPDGIMQNESGQNIVSYTGIDYSDFQTRLNHLNDKTFVDPIIRKELLLQDICCFIPYEKVIELNETINRMKDFIIPRQNNR